MDLLETSALTNTHWFLAGRERTRLSRPHFNGEEILSLASFSKTSFPLLSPSPHFLRTCCSLTACGDTKTLLCALPSPLPQNSFSSSPPPTCCPAFSSLPSSCCAQRQTSHLSSSVSTYHGPESQIHPRLESTFWGQQPSELGRSPSAQASGTYSDSDLDAGLFRGIQELHPGLLLPS